MGGSCTVIGWWRVQWEGAVQLLVGGVISARELYSYWLVL